MRMHKTTTSHQHATKCTLKWDHLTERNKARYFFFLNRLFLKELKKGIHELDVTESVDVNNLIESLMHSVCSTGQNVDHYVCPVP